MNDRIAIVAGIRTPFCKAGGVLKDMEADDLGAFVVTELIARSGFPPEKVDELIFGNVLSPPQSANIARILAVKGGLPVKVPAFTVNRNCASGLEAITTASNKILQGHADVVIAGGTESMSNAPVVISNHYRNFLQKLLKAKGWKQKIKILLSFRPKFLVPQMPELNDPLCDLSMGQTAEILSREFKVSRQEQDDFALASQQRVQKGLSEGHFDQEVAPIPVPPYYNAMQTKDEGPRSDTSKEGLAKLRPSFDSATGTVTAGNASQITDGAAAVLLMRESKAKELGLTPLGYIRDYTYAGLQPNRMGLGPAFAISKLLKRTGLELKDFDLVEINEAFAAQVLAVRKALASEEFAKKELDRDKAVGDLDLNKLNVNGGAIALGHPLGASGTRLVLTLLNELKRRNLNRGLATLCVGGGQGEAIAVEVK